MELRIQNKNLQNTINLLFDLPLRGKQSRHRSKLVKILQKNLTEVGEQEREMLLEHCHLDEQGEPKMLDSGMAWDAKDPETFMADRQEFYNEEVVIAGPANEEVLKTVLRILDECDKEFSGAEAVIYDELFDQLEDQELEVSEPKTEEATPLS